MSEEPKKPLIDKVYVAKVQYPVYDHFKNPSEVFYTTGETLVYQATSPIPVIVPAAITKDVKFRVELTQQALTEAIPSLTPPYSLTAQWNQWQFFASIDKATPVDLLKDLTLQAPTIEGMAKALPWQIDTEVEWTLKCSDPKKPIYKANSAFELHILHPGLPAYLDRSGIPRRLLKWNQLLPRWMKRKDNDWTAFVVETIFNDPRMQYENWSGAANYRGELPEEMKLGISRWGRKEFWLDLWLSDMNGLSGSQVLQLNCEDIACLVQILSALGLDADSQKGLRLKKLEPYGYLKPAKLMGRVDRSPNASVTNPNDECNNPFYGRANISPLMLCDPKAANRSYFGNHFFVTVERNGKEYVLDACAGPHVGVSTLPEYIQKAIDTGPNPTVQSGKVNNAKNLIGVDSLVRSCTLERTVAPPPTSDLLIDKVTKLPNTGTWSTPFFSTPATSRSTEITYHLQPSWKGAEKEILTITIFRYEWPKWAEEAYQRRISSLEQWSVETKEEGYTDDGPGSIRIFCNPSLNYMAIVKASTLKSDVTKGLKDQLKSLLDSIKLSPSTKLFDIIENKTDPLSVKVGSQFELVARVSSR